MVMKSCCGFVRRGRWKSTEALVLEKVRARQMMALMEGGGGAWRGPESKETGAAGRGWGDADGGAAGTGDGAFSGKSAAAEMWESDAWIRMVLWYMIASEGEYRVGFLDGSEVKTEALARG